MFYIPIIIIAATPPAVLPTITAIGACIQGNNTTKVCSYWCYIDYLVTFIIGNFLASRTYFCKYNNSYGFIVANTVDFLTRTVYTFKDYS